jgi:transcription initiation factor TFIIIB Brf1 subunit/transcription initiation factor TFIIB
MFQTTRLTGGDHVDDDDQQHRCPWCGTRGSTRQDWSQGDVVCVACGLVQEERVLDSSPEWRIYDSEKNAIAANQRSGLIPVNESKYLGGLAPTSWSKRPFGDKSAASFAQTRKRLLIAQDRADSHVATLHRRGMQAAALNHRVLQRRRRDEDTTTTTADETDEENSYAVIHDESIRPELELVVMQQQQQQELERLDPTNQWSLEHALKVFENDEDPTEDEAQLASGYRRPLRRAKQRSPPTNTAAVQVYWAYRTLQDVTAALNLEPLQAACMQITCQFAQSKRGFGTSRQPDRDWNQRKQIAALLAAVLFYTGRRNGYPRSMEQLCRALRPGPSLQELAAQKTWPNAAAATNDAWVEKRDFSRAVAALRETLPSFMKDAPSRKVEQNIPALHNFVNHAVRRLELPPLAVACIRELVASRGNDLAVECAALTVFVCQMGSVMQTLAHQAVSKKRPACQGASSSSSKRRKGIVESAMEATAMKQVSLDSEISQPFPDAMESEHREYEMRRLWDAWMSQLPWSRNVTDICQAVPVTPPALRDCFQHIFPQRRTLLVRLKDAARDSSTDLGRSPLASVLLPSILLAEPLLDAKV